MLTDFGERRQAGRWAPSPVDPLSRARLRAGRELSVIDLSPLGMLVEGTTRLLPGTQVDVHLTAARGRSLVRARVVRCAVFSVTPDVVGYRGALAFCTPVDLAAVQHASPLEDPQPA